MSTLKSINVIHPSSATNNIVNDASGNVAVGNNLTVAGTATVGGVAAVAVAPGTSGNVLKSNGTIWQSAAPAATASLTLLATLTTTSGTTQSATGLATTYTNLVIVCSGVGNSTASTSSLTIAVSSNNGSSYGTASNYAQYFGATPILLNGNFGNIYLANQSTTSGRPFGTGLTNYYGTVATTTAAPINAVQFSWSNVATFNAGAIYIYGWN